MKMFKSKKDENVEVKQDENTEEKKVRTKRLDFDKLIGDQNSERMDQLVFRQAMIFWVEGLESATGIGNRHTPVHTTLACVDALRPRRHLDP